MDLSSRSAFEQWSKSKLMPMLRVFDKYWLEVDPDDDSLTPCLVRDGYWESWVSLAIAREIGRRKSPPSCVDVGANVGYYTLLMLATGAGRVTAIEPHPRVNRILQNTLAANQLLNVVSVSQCGVWSRLAKAMLNEFGRKIGSSSLLTFDGAEVTKSYEIDLMPLDILLVSWKEIDFVKMDVEGAEPEAWRGMEDIRARCGPTVCVEIHDRHKYDVGAFLARIREDGYDIRAVREDGEIVELDEEAVRPWTLWLTKQ